MNKKTDFIERRNFDDEGIVVLQTPPPPIDSPLHTISLRDMSAWQVRPWLKERGISRGYVYSHEGVKVMSYYECDKMKVTGG